MTALLLTVMDEETTFFTLCSIVDGLVPEYYRWAARSRRRVPPPHAHCLHLMPRRSPSMVGSNVDQRVFAELVGEKFPAIAKHLTDIGLPIVIVSLPWFLCLFIS